MNSGQLALGIVLGENSILVFQRYSDCIYNSVITTILANRLYVKARNAELVLRQTVRCLELLEKHSWQQTEVLGGGVERGMLLLRKGWGGSTRAYPEDSTLQSPTLSGNSPVESTQSGKSPVDSGGSPVKVR